MATQEEIKAKNIAIVNKQIDINTANGDLQALQNELQGLYLQQQLDNLQA